MSTLLTQTLFVPIPSKHGYAIDYTASGIKCFYFRSSVSVICPFATQIYDLHISLNMGQLS